MVIKSKVLRLSLTKHGKIKDQLTNQVSKIHPIHTVDFRVRLALRSSKEELSVPPTKSSFELFLAQFW
jgi:hypothetical protein